MAFDPKKYLLAIAGQEPPEAAALLLIDTLMAENKSKWSQAEYEAAVQLLISFDNKYLASSLGIPEKKEGTESSDKYFGRIVVGAKQIVKRKLASVTHKISLQEYKKQIDDALDIYKTGQPKFGFAKLESDEKALCRGYLEEIKKIVEKSKLDSEKKNAILRRVNELLAEVDKDYTPVDGFSALIGDFLVSYVGLAEKAKPALEITRKLLRTIIGRSAVDQGIVLPPPEDLPLLGAPEDKESATPSRRTGHKGKAIS